MPQNRVAMRKIREILRLAWSCSQTRQSISDSCGLGKTTVTDTLYRASAAGLSWPLSPDLDDERLERLLYPVHPRAITSRRTPPDWSTLHNELLSHKNLTLMLLWQEYKEREPSGYQYSQFCDLFRFWRGKLDLSMRQEHRAGEKMFVDYCG
jgi:transposase